MELSEKLQELRKEKGLTQEELAEALFVSRTAISKWESGRGVPNIESLKAISKFFSVSIDELLSGEEILKIADEDNKQKEKHTRDLVFGLLDCSLIMFLFLPFFGQKGDEIIKEVCKHGHEWEASVKSRTVNGTGCPYCSHNKVLAGFNDLASQYPDIAAEWSDRNLPLLPTMVTAFANSKAWWKCKDCGNEWHTLISTRAGGSRCPYCSGYTLLKGFNDLATTHPELAAEWSERNYPLMPDEVNAKSRRNVWWKCKTCGNEWKSVINARVKGTVCPVCADRAVLTGYNDLATTDRKLLVEWDYEKNSLLPTQVSRKSLKSVWWKCSLGHSWKAKISDRTILEGKCTVCESEYRSVFPGLAVAYYANQKGLKVQLGSDKLLGIPLETYIPSEKLAIEFTSGSEQMEVLKSHLCKQRNIKLVKLPFKTTETEAEYADRVKAVFKSVHIFIYSDVEADVSVIRAKFNEWRKRL